MRIPIAVGKYRVLAEACRRDGVQTLIAVDSERRRYVVKRSLETEPPARFRNQLLIGPRFRHPNLLRTHDIGLVFGHPYLVTELLAGWPLSVLLREVGRSGIPMRLHLHILIEALKGLHAAHNVRGAGDELLDCVHLALAPRKIFVTYDGDVKVLGFSRLERHDACPTEAVDTRNEGDRLRFCAPEQLLGVRPDRRSDVFAIGVLLWEALARRALVTSGAPVGVTYYQRVTGTWPKLEDLAPATPPLLAAISERAMAVDPRDRFETAYAMTADLHDAWPTVGGEPTRSELRHFMLRAFQVELSESGSFPPIQM